MHTPHRSFFLTAAPLFLIIFIDCMGMGLIVPILNTVIMDPRSGFFLHHISTYQRNFWFGLTVGLFMLCWLFGEAFLSDLSDQIGRKKSLLISLFGSAAGYFISACGVILHSLTLIILGRVIAGFTAGSQATAQAAVIDLSDKSLIARHIGMTMFISSLGFILGPLIGGFFSDRTLLPWTNLAMPLYFAAALSLINVLLLIVFFKETFVTTQKVYIKLSRVIEIFTSAFRHEKLKFLALVLFTLAFGWGGFYTFVSVFY